MPLHRTAPPALLVAALVLAAPHAAADIFTVGVGTGCTHATIQQAIDAAQANPGADTIRVTRSLGYTQQALTVNTAQDLSIVGGFATCSQAASDGTRTTVSGAGGALVPVFTITGQTGSVIRIRQLTITGGDTAGEGHGGGIHYLGNGRLELIETDVSGNTAGYGGGIYADGQGDQAELLLSNDVVIAGNTARYSGGGIYLNDMNMRMEAPGSILFNNTAQGLSDRGFGGGLIIRANNRSARALVGSNGIGSLGTIAGNSARYGGGVAAIAESIGRIAHLDLFSTDASQRTSIRDNIASVVGGGIYGRPYRESGFLTVGDSVSTLWNADLLLNVAPDGAAVYLEDDSSFGMVWGAHLWINSWWSSWNGGSMNGPPSGAVPCQSIRHCGRIAGNQTRNASNEPTTGAIIRMNRDTRFYSNWNAVPGAPPSQGGGVLFTDNTAGRLIDVADNNDGSVVRLRNAVMHGNALSLQVLRATGGGSQVEIRDSTVAGNSINGSHVMSVQGDFGLTAGLVWQPGKTVLSHGGGSRIVSWSMANEAASLGGGPWALQIAGPRFIDPDRGDYRLRAASPAIDHAPADPDSTGDADSRPRDVALPVPWSDLRLRDAGAYERQSISPLVLNGDFASDLNLWTSAGGVTSTWDGSQNAVGGAGSGSLHVNQAGVPQVRVVVRSQCVHLPAGGRYRLNGWGRAGIGTPATRDGILLNWQLRHDGAESCTQGPANASADHFLTSSSNWTQPATPALVELAPEDWTVNSSLTVSLVVNDNGGTAPLTVTGWFDGITLDFEPFNDVIFANGFD